MITILKIIGYILFGIIITNIFGKVRGFIFKKAKGTIMPKNKLNASIGKQFTKKGSEAFNIKKFKKMFDVSSKVEWIKSIKEIIDLRKIILYLTILSVIYGVAYYRGQQGKPVKFNLSWNKAFHIKLNGHYLHKPMNSNNLQIVDKNDKLIKTIRVKDLPELQKKLAPFGLEFQPIFVVGGGASNGKLEGELGAGFSWLKYYKWRLESFLTNKGIYPASVSYKLTDNSGVGLGVGKGWKNFDNRVMLYYKFNF